MNPWLATLQWYADLGVDEAIADESWNRLTTPADPPQPGKAPVASPMARSAASDAQAPSAPTPAPAAKPDAAKATVAAVPPSRLSAELASIGDLEALRARLELFEGCALKATATNTVFGTGPADAELMIIGEAPGAEEDRRGEPFVGASGQLLDRMLAAIGRARSSVYITNTLYWRPPGNRTPTPAEIQTCLPFLRRQITLVRPRVLLLVGGAAAKTMLQRPEGIMRLRGRWFEYADDEDRLVPVLATFHPAYLLRSPAQKREAWRDLLALQNRLDTEAR